MQQVLFAEAGYQNKPLVIGKNAKQGLTKSQQDFNKLTVKIEKLRKDIEHRSFEFDKAVAIYGKEYHPKCQELLVERRKMLDTLLGMYRAKRLSQPDQKLLKKYLQNQLQLVFADTAGEPDDALKKIFFELEGESYDKVRREEELVMQAEMQEMLDEHDIDVDLSKMDMRDGKTVAETMAELEEKMREKEAEQEERARLRKQNKRKTPKQLAKEKLQEAAAELQNKNISTIYKQLAKLFHPDLERDEFRRKEKEELMKELTAAYEAKNLHALLSLELKWINQENDHLESLTEEKLSIYLHILREQARKLEHEKKAIYTKPNYSVLVSKFGMEAARNPIYTVSRASMEIDNIIVLIKKDVETFNSPTGQREVKKIINAWWRAQQEEEMDMDDLFDMLFSKKGGGGFW